MKHKQTWQYVLKCVQEYTNRSLYMPLNIGGRVYRVGALYRAPKQRPFFVYLPNETQMGEYNSNITNKRLYNTKMLLCRAWNVRQELTYFLEVSHITLLGKEKLKKLDLFIDNPDIYSLNSRHMTTCTQLRVIRELPLDWMPGQPIEELVK